ncbi:anti-sigma factor [Burkholderia lata]|uniref:Anti-sigma K factor RskA C-terminal domain-containing protein n=1 Tax=Burkholderia lata (strain ATCC 17760 / DSM 23089 / LMG 22485 / NCIMB 9086 / R18194 / 383) TaxID=482957 RepID=Q39PH9_BURL3|nr:anti-sigma factor [Burkholderia lata]ABB05637.1 conserved hypothetical protein [Burkholderia lata]
MNTPADHDPELRCAEYALGLLDADARRALEHAVDADPALKSTLERWQRRLAPLAEDIAPVEPPGHVWTRIQRDVGFLLRSSARGAAPTGGWWNSVNLWRWVGISASAAALGLLAINLVWVREASQRTTAVESNYMVATISRSDGVAHWTATVDLPRARMVVVPADKPTIAVNRSTELWLIPPNAKPISLGVFPPDAPASMTLPPAVVAQLSARAVLAVSIEPSGGSPTGQPTGPVLATGTLHAA